MRIVFTAGGTGGHFYPIIAIAEELNRIVAEEKLLPPELFYFAPTAYDERALFENNIAFRMVGAGKWRRYFSPLNLIDGVKTALGVVKAVFTVFSVYPDLVFGKGGYASFPTLFAARLFGIPVVIHESDAEPGRVNLWAGKFAKRVAVSYREAAKYFPEKKVAYTGQPIRRDLRLPLSEGAREFLHLEETTLVILILGGSLGSSAINEAILEALPKLLEKYQVIHQTGEKNFSEISGTAGVILKNHPHKERYRPFAYLNALSLRMAAGVSSLVISRAGSALFEIGSWGLPAIVIPIRQEVSHDQMKNAYAYARTGAARVIEEKNLNEGVLIFEVERVMENKELRQKMGEAGKAMVRPDAAQEIAREILNIGLSHEQ